MERIKVVGKLQVYTLGSVHFWYMIHPKKLWNLQIKRPQYPWVPKLKVFTVILSIVSKNF